MPRRLRKFDPPVLGLAGAIVGFFWSYVLLSSDGDGCSCDWSTFQYYFGWPLLTGSLIGLVGTCLYFRARRTGGAFLIGGGVVASPLLVFVATGIVPSPALLVGLILYFGLILGPGFFAALLLFLSGLLSFQKTRRIIKSLHDGGWIP